jgi:heme exporter protein A
MRIERVEIRGLVKTFGATAALRGVDAEMEGGELVLVEGPNGSGKTTLLRVLGTTLRPTTGSVRYEPMGEATGGRLESVRAEVGWLSHDALAYGDLSARDNVILAARLHGVEAAGAWSTASERFDLERFADRPLRTVSRGQRQRVALARALVHAPSLLLLDEPTTGLDRSGIELLLRVVDEQLARGATLAVVTHDPAPLGDRAHRRLELERGQVVRQERLRVADGKALVARA